ncbi:MAG: hypothetical protein WBP41_06985 [Saprospiraceae bacterium]
MQKTLTLLLFSFLSTYVLSQKVNTKDFNVDAKFQQLPLTALDPAFTTYDVAVDGEAGALALYGQTLTSIKKSITLGGYNRVGGGGSVSIKASIGIPTASKVTLNTEDKSDKDGHKWKEYSYFHDLSIASSYRIIDYKGNTIDEKPMASTDRISTAVYRTIQELSNVYNKEYPAALTNKMRSMLAENIQAINNSINYNYGLAPRSKSVEFTTIQSKDHPDFPAYEKIRTGVEAAFAAMTADDISKCAEMLQPAIDFWTGQEKKYDPLNKDERKMNYYLRVNLVNAYYWIDRYDEAANYISKIAQGEVSEKAAKNRLEELSKFRNNLKTLGFAGQHTKLIPSAEENERSAKYANELESIYAAGDVRQFEDFESKLGVTKSSRVEPATMYYKNGTTDEGYLVYEAVKAVPDFRQPKYIRFGKAVDRNTVATSMDYSTLDSMRIKGQLYHVETVQLHAGILNLKMENAIIEKIKEYNRSNLVIVYPPFMYAKGIMGGDEMEPDVYMFHKGRKEYLSTTGLLGFTKAMSKNVEDCKAAVDYLASMKGKPDPIAQDDRLKQFSNTGLMVEALRIYDDCGN